MKKIKKNRSRSHHSRHSPPKGGATPEPPAGFVKEMVDLFNAGAWPLFEQKAHEAVKQWPGSSLGWKALGNLYLMLGKPADALKFLTKSIELDPADAQAHQNLGSVFLGLGRLPEAEARYRQALALNPEYAQAHSNLGITLLELGRLEEAVASYWEALVHQWDFPEAHNNLGNALKELRRLDEAEASYRNALTIKPDFAEAHSNLGYVLLELRRLDEAEKSFRQALALKPDYARACSGLGDTLLGRGQFSDAIPCYRQCIDLDPLWIKAHDGLNQALSRLVPLWHPPMMNDHRRNDAYFAALKNAVTPDSHVLEIGTGSGLLAMMAGRLGARQVTTCEAVAEIAETARAILADNGCTPPVTVIPKMSSKMEVGTDMDDRADLLVSEILSSELLGEGVLSSIEDARRRLLKPGARIIPAGGSIQFALFGGAGLEQNIRVDEVCGFDLSKFNEIIARKQYISRNDLDIELLSDDATAFFFDFSQTERVPSHERKTIEVVVRKEGRCCGIIQWIKLEMDDSVVFENHPSEKKTASGWQWCVYRFPSVIDVLPGQTAVISAAHNRSTPWFFFEKIK